MRRFIISVLLSAFPMACVAQDAITTAAPEMARKAESPGAPKNLEECFVELERILSGDELEEFKNANEDEIVKYNQSIGKLMQDKWGAWPGSHLRRYFIEMGIFHPDDMTNIILTSFHRRLNNKDINLEQQIGYYRQYWQMDKTPPQVSITATPDFPVSSI